MRPCQAATTHCITLLRIAVTRIRIAVKLRCIAAQKRRVFSAFLRLCKLIATCADMQQHTPAHIGDVRLLLRVTNALTPHIAAILHVLPHCFDVYLRCKVMLQLKSDASQCNNDVLLRNNDALLHCNESMLRSFWVHASVYSASCLTHMMKFVCHAGSVVFTPRPASATPIPFAFAPRNKPTTPGKPSATAGSVSATPGNNAAIRRNAPAATRKHQTTSRMKSCYFYNTTLAICGPGIQYLG